MKKIKALGLLAVGLGAIATAGAPITVSTPDVQTSQQQHRDMQRGVKSDIKERIKIQARASMQTYAVREGIPPHIYGQYHVRRGTHKKNK